MVTAMRETESTIESEAVFRIRFLPVFLTTSIAANAIILILDAREKSIIYLVTAALVSVALLALLSLIAVSVLKVRVDDHGIRGHDSIGLPRRMAWDSIRTVRIFSCPGIPFYRLFSTEGRREMWLPGFLVNAPAFLEMVESLAGVDNPLSECLRDHV